MFKPVEECTTLFDLFEDPTRWCQKAVAQDSKGNVICCQHEKASKWCLVGGLLRLHVGTHHFHEKWKILKQRIGNKTIHEWQDDPTTTHEMILEKIQGL